MESEDVLTVTEVLVRWRPDPPMRSTRSDGKPLDQSADEALEQRYDIGGEG